ncbi:MAG: sigma-70 family RNA polymerase sigma factor, partial [Nanoarchaeota archaeon]
MTRNLCFNDIRDRKRRTRILKQTGASLYDQTEEQNTIQDARANVYQKELQHGVEVAIKKLSEDHEVIIRLRYQNDLLYDEIAEKLGIPVGTVMSRL